jgi:thiosulfate/3-mercaptopyruvate sulfurtransferase
MNQLSIFISANLWLVIAFVIILIAYFIFESKQKNKQNKQISSQEAIRLTNKEKAIFIDVREEAEYKLMHIIGAIHFNTAAKSFAHLKRYQSNPIILYNERNASINTIYKNFIENGFNNVKILDGGITQWKSESLPTKKFKN